ncbi:hypothetical protein SNOG_01485 [Parastagonospora nodorum SN15]|uniref:Uncharacterized protein n=1 Tax=Phaeosphaeria nodorum (strain SN15 / ATCC MYA-4574 / FGSC 10173) TaxID=321614 RepID=Q0V3C9_PHANO|nr:hypothetical protein SNOG_01485 [Parastagonospora nodorum SN15]EAT91134.1 hypothetical protein SNOG_01485 [Parastagonospora nodorum SN15]
MLPSSQNSPWFWSIQNHSQYLSVQFADNASVGPVDIGKDPTDPTVD